jgi:hypothetical protein
MDRPFRRQHISLGRSKILQDTSIKDTTMKSKNVFLLAVAVLMVVAAGVQARSIAAETKSDDPKTAVVSIKGQVLYGRQPAPKITISLEGPSKATATSDANGEFVFNDLPAGPYTLEAKGTAKNNIRKGSAKVTVAEAAKEPATVTIKLN